MKFDYPLRPVAALDVVAVAIYPQHADVVLQLKDAEGSQVWTGTAKIGDANSIGYVLNKKLAAGYHDVLIPLEIIVPGAFTAVRRRLACKGDHLAATTALLIKLGLLPKPDAAHP